jgi:hypothetical protein
MAIRYYLLWLVGGLVELWMLLVVWGVSAGPGIPPLSWTV